MNKSVYAYSLLQYRHSQLLGEVLNIGLLVWFPKELRLAFIHPKGLTRISRVYPNVQESTIKKYLKSFSLRVKELNARPNAFVQDQLDESLLYFAQRELLPPDSSALQFAPSRKAIALSNSYDDILKNLYNLYFVAYNTDQIDSQKVDDQQITSRYKGFLRDIQREFQLKSNSEVLLKENERLQYNYPVVLSESEKFKFEVAWQNGSLNLVQPMSFDLVNEDYIVSKSLRYYGQFLEMAQYAEERNVRVDLLLVEPRKKSLSKAYDNALRILQKPGYTNFIEERELKSYSEKTILAINKPNS